MNRNNLIKLREILTQHFNKGELRTLCSDLGIDYDNLGNGSKADHARELVGHFERRSRAEELEETVKRLRPNAPWGTAPGIHSSRWRKHRTEIIVALIVAAAVIIAVIGLRGTNDNDETPVTSFAYQVQVEDQTTGKAVKDAKVTIYLTGGKAPLRRITDSNGFARIIIDSTYSEKPGGLTVEADGYETYEEYMDLNKEDLPTIVRLSPKP